MNRARFKVTSSALTYRQSPYRCTYDGLYVVAINNEAVRLLLEYRHAKEVKRIVDRAAEELKRIINGMVTTK